MTDPRLSFPLPPKLPGCRGDTDRTLLDTEGGSGAFRADYDIHTRCSLATWAVAGDQV